MNFKIGDLVVLDLDNPLNRDLASHKVEGELNDIVFTITGVNVAFVDVDHPVLKTQITGDGWMRYRFKDAKNTIVNQILSDL